MSFNSFIFFFFSYLKRFATPPIVLATPSHQFPERPQDAMAVWVEELTEDSFKICLREVKIFDGLHKGITIVSRDKILFLKTCIQLHRLFLATHMLYCIQIYQNTYKHK